MAVDWDGVLVSLVDSTADSYEQRVHRQILFAGLVGAALIVLWRVLAWH